MLKSARFWILAVIGLIAIILATDWLYSISRMRNIQMDISANPDTVVADGKSATILTIKVTENGKPRSHDLIQLWLDKGAGLIIPTWVFTDENGVAEVTYTPNPYSPYDPQDGSVISIQNTSIGRLVEVDQLEQITIKLEEPK